MVVRWSSSAEEYGQNEKGQSQRIVSRRAMQILDNLNMRIKLVRVWSEMAEKSTNETWTEIRLDQARLDLAKQQHLSASPQRSRFEPIPLDSFT